MDSGNLGIIQQLRHQSLGVAELQAAARSEMWLPVDRCIRARLLLWLTGFSARIFSAQAFADSSF